MLSKRRFGTAAVLGGGLTLLMLVGVAGVARAAGAEEPGAPPAAQAAQDEKGTLEIYGFGQADAIVDFKQNNPDWYDVNRPSRLPNVANQFGKDGRFYLSVRQSRLGVKGEVPTASGPVKGQFEFDMFGVGGDAGKTTIRLRHAWGQWKQFGAGQTNSQFMDIDVFPNVIDYWGPNGMLFFRNVQVFWEPFNDGSSHARVAIEAPGASGDAGLLSDRVELQNVKPRYPSPDFTGHYRLGGKKWGYVQLGGALRYIGYDDLLPNDKFDLNGNVWGWGVSLSSNVKLGSNDTLRLQVVDGAGVENYFNDAPVDVGDQEQPRQRGDAGRGRGAPGLRPRHLSGPQLEFEVLERDRLLARRYHQQQRPVGQRLQERRLHRRESARDARQERDDGRRVPVRAPRKQLGRLRGQRLPPAVLVQIQLWLQARRTVMFRNLLSTRRRRFMAVIAASVMAGGLVLTAQGPDPQTAVNNAFNQFKTLKEGKNADYIPALAKVDPNLYGIALITVDGKVFTAGDIKTEVSIQSISKVFTMAQVIQEQGLDAIEKRIGVDATGARFNSIIAVEGVRTVVGTGAPEMNPLVNPGAISATSMVTGASSDAVWKKIIGFHNDAAGRSLTVLQDVYKSESDSNQRNQAIGALMLAYGYIKSNWPQAVDLYTRQCSIGVNAKDLATMAATLAAGGKNPVTGKVVLDAAKVPGVLAVMATAGLYDDSGKWLYHTGLPAKSGVGGGIIAVAPGKFGIAVISPPLDDAGNSVRAQRTITAISNALGANPYAVRPK